MEAVPECFSGCILASWLFQTFDGQMTNKYGTWDILLLSDKDDRNKPMHNLDFNFHTSKAQCGHEIMEFSYTKMKILSASNHVLC